MTILQSSSDHYERSALIAERAVQEARKAQPGGFVAVARTINQHQVAQAQRSARAVGEQLAEQDIDAAAQAILNNLAFTTGPELLEPMLDAAGDDGFDRLVESLVQDAGRAAEQVAIVTRPRIYHVRFLTPPSCSRCAVLAGRRYRWSEGFLRHPGCDCVMIPTTVASDELVQDPVELMRLGLVTGLSKADRRAIDDGADFGQVVNVRQRSAGLHEPGRVLARRGRLTPEGIYAQAETREEAIELLAANGYLMPPRISAAPEPQLEPVRPREVPEVPEPVEAPVVVEVPPAPRELATMTEEELEAELADLMAAEDYGPRLDEIGEELDRRATADPPPPIEVPPAPDPVAEAEALNRLLFGDTTVDDLAAARANKRRDPEAELRDEYTTWVHTQWLRAEEETRGVLLSKRGELAFQRGDFVVEDLFTRKRRSLEYASEELQRWFSEPGNQRMSYPEFRAGRMDDKKAREALGRLRNRGFESEFG